MKPSSRLPSTPWSLSTKQIAEKKENKVKKDDDDEESKKKINKEEVEW